MQRAGAGIRSLDEQFLDTTSDFAPRDPFRFIGEQIDGGSHSEYETFSTSSILSKSLHERQNEQPRLKARLRM
jgi:hypothetical protein